MWLSHSAFPWALVQTPKSSMPSGLTSVRDVQKQAWTKIVKIMQTEENDREEDCTFDCTLVYPNISSNTHVILLRENHIFLLWYSSVVLSFAKKKKF